MSVSIAPCASPSVPQKRSSLKMNCRRARKPLLRSTQTSQANGRTSRKRKILCQTLQSGTASPTNCSIWSADRQPRYGNKKTGSLRASGFLWRPRSVADSVLGRCFFCRCRFVEATEPATHQLLDVTLAVQHLNYRQRDLINLGHDDLPGHTQVFQ